MSTYEFLAGDPHAGIVRSLLVYGCLLFERSTTDAENLYCIYASQISTGLHLSEACTIATRPLVYRHTGLFTLNIIIKQFRCFCLLPFHVPSKADKK